MGHIRETSSGIARLAKELAKAKNVALDTMIFSYHYFGHPGLHVLAKTVFSLIEVGTVRAYASWLSIGELLVEIRKASGEADAKTYLDFIQSFPNLTLLPMDKQIMLDFSEVRGRMNLGVADCIHIATAQAANADLLISNDYAWRNRFAKPKLILLGDYLN